MGNSATSTKVGEGTGVKVSVEVGVRVEVGGKGVMVAGGKGVEVFTGGEEEMVEHALTRPIIRTITIITEFVLNLNMGTSPNYSETYNIRDYYKTKR